MAAQRRGHQPVGERAVAAIGDLGRRERARSVAAQHCAQPLGGDEAEREPRAVLLFSPSSLSPRGRAAARSLAVGRRRHAPAATYCAGARSGAAGRGAGRRPLVVHRISAASLLQRGDAVLDIRVGREQIVHPRARQRVEDVHVRHRRIALGRDVDRAAARSLRNLAQRRGQRQRLAAKSRRRRGRPRIRASG